MREITGGKRSLRFLLLVAWIFQQFISGFSTDSSSSKSGTPNAQTSGSVGSKVVIVCFVLVAVILLSFFLFKLWQKKKREEQYARLLKLFEEDDELELELGLRE